MDFSEKLYRLRKQSGLSQEELAEKLEVSRQAVSKWESGASMPESGKLPAISAFFGVSLDYLLGDADEAPEAPAQPQQSPAPSRGRRAAGAALCLAAAACLIVWGIISVFGGEAGEQIAQSSAVTLDGNGILLLLCALALAAGAFMFFKGSARGTGGRR